MNDLSLFFFPCCQGINKWPFAFFIPCCQGINEWPFAFSFVLPLTLLHIATAKNYGFCVLLKGFDLMPPGYGEDPDVIWIVSKVWLDTTRLKRKILMKDEKQWQLVDRDKHSHSDQSRPWIETKHLQDGLCQNQAPRHAINVGQQTLEGRWHWALYT